jgi:hypothetical protein
MPPHFLQRAVLMGNQCDWACWFLKEMVTGVVRKSEQCLRYYFNSQIWLTERS